MRTCVFALSLALTACVPFLNDPRTDPFRPAVQISIPDAPGWSFDNKDLALFEAFTEEVEDRMDTSDGVISTTSFQHPTGDHRVILTLAGEHPEQILTLMMPLFRASNLPQGTVITKFTGSRGQVRARVAL
jgi:hypothetical protein